jgi:hypothetical protein
VTVTGRRMRVPDWSYACGGLLLVAALPVRCGLWVADLATPDALAQRLWPLALLLDTAALTGLGLLVIGLAGILLDVAGEARRDRGSGGAGDGAAGSGAGTAAHLPAMSNSNPRTVPGTFATVPDDIDGYLAGVHAESEAARRDAALREQAHTDPALQCHHAVSLYENCRPCGVEAGEVPGYPGEGAA